MIFLRNIFIIASVTRLSIQCLKLQSLIGNVSMELSEAEKGVDIMNIEDKLMKSSSMIEIMLSQVQKHKEVLNKG